jgi:hypothetical protein
MVAGARGDGDFDLRVLLCEGGEMGLQEFVHAATAAGPVAVVEVEALALEDEGAHAVLEMH